MIGLPEAPIRNACDRYRYAPRVFVAPPWQEIYTTDTERKQDFAEAQCTYELIVRVYEECGYELVELPRLAPNERASFIMQTLELV